MRDIGQMGFGVRFVERMSGWICFDERGIRYPFEINLHVFSRAIFRQTHPRQFKGYALLTGFPSAAGTPDSWLAPKVAGTLTTTLQGVSYDFDMPIDGGVGQVHVVGRKVYRWNPFRLSEFFSSLVELPLEIFKDGKKIGSAFLVYRNPLWQFFLGIRIVRESYAFDHRLKLAQKITSLSPVLVTNPERYSPESRTLQRISFQLAGAPGFLIVLFALTVPLIRFISYLMFGQKIESLSPAQRELFAKILTKNKILNPLIAPVSTFLVTALFSDPDYLKRYGQNQPVPPLQEEPERWMSLCFTPTSQHSLQPLDVDVVIVGSGAGGAAAAYELAGRGLAVAVVEEGHFYKRQQFTGNRLEMVRRLYRASGVSFPVSNSIVWLPTGKCVGGTTVINCGTCLRPPQNTLKRWESELGLKDLKLDPYFEEVERILDVKPVPSDIQGCIAKVLERGLKGSKFQLKPLLRGETGCDGQSFCIFGCPTGAKKSTNFSFIPEAMKRNTYLFTHYKAQKILLEGDRAIGVLAGMEGYGNEFNLEIRAKKVILAAGTLNTPHLLRRLKIAHSLKHIGRNLTLHPAVNVGAWFDGPVRERLFVPQSMGGFETDHENDFVLEGHTLLVDSIPIFLLFFGNALDEVMTDPTRFTNFAAMHLDSTRGRLVSVPGVGLMPFYFFDKKKVQALQRSVCLLTETFLRAGARTVFPSVRGFEKISSFKELDRLKDAKLSASHFKNLSAHHPLGTCQMGADPSCSVVSPDGQVWGVKDLYVADGSVIPGPLGANPQVTIMANALRVARQIGDSLA